MTRASCNNILWNRQSSKTRSNHPCLGCTEPGFPHNDLMKGSVLKTMKHLGLKINRYESIDYENLKNYKCARPRYMLMNSDKLKMILKFKVPNLKDEIKKIKNEI